ncbi:MAG: DUF2817 domain-containing protein [Alistipes sp.]|nr:DUF2817 domain-containing protein [Alistipes sp.]
MAYDLRHPGEEIDDAVSAVETGKVVTDNTVSSIASGEAKPASADAIAKELQKKVDKVEGKGLSTNDYDNEEMAQVDRVRNGSVVVDNTLSALDEASNKPVSSKGIAEAIEAKMQMPKSINALDYGWIVDGKYVSIDNGYISDSSSLSCLNTMQPTNGKKRLVTVVAMSVTAGGLGVVFYNANREVFASLRSNEIDQYTSTGVTYVRVNIPIPDGARYFNVSYLSEAKKIELNAPDFYCYLTSENNSGDVDVSYMPIKSGYITASTGDIVGTTNWANICYKEPISTFGKKYLYISGMVLLNAIDRGIAFYDENKQYVSGIKWSDIYLNKSQRESLMMLIPIPQNARYFNATYWGRSQVQEYNLLQPKITCILTDKGNQQLPVVSGDFGSWIDIADYTGETGSALTALTYNDWIAKWDALQSQYSAQISAKSIIGYATLEGDSSAIAVQDESRPIYEYIINPLPFNEDNIGYLEYPTPLQPNKVKILINTGIHGKEKTASMAVYLFAQRLLEDEKYLSLLSNCEIHICPCSNPWAYDNNERNNARNVNVNRNFGYNWEHQVGGNATEKGSAPYSECETQALQSWMAKHSDMNIYLDVHHNALGASPKQGIYAYTYSLFLNALYCSFLREASARARIKYPNIFTDAKLIGYSGHTITSGSVTEAYFVHNVEYVMTSEDNANVGGAFSSTAIELAEAQVTNMLRVIIKNAPKTLKW